MPYVQDFDQGFDDEWMTTLTENYDDDEPWESGGFGEAARPRIGPTYRRDHRRSRQPALTLPPSSSPPQVAGVHGAAITQAGPGGRPQVRFEKPVATKESVEDLSRGLRRDVSVALAGIKSVDQTLDKNTSILDKKVAALEAIVAKANKQAQEQTQMNLLLPLLLSQDPQLEKVTFAATPAPNTEVAVTSSVFKKNDNSLLFLMLAMGGGFGGGGESGGMNMMLPLLLLTGGLGK